MVPAANLSMPDFSRDENIRVRSTRPEMPEIYSGPYPPGEALPETPVEGGADIAGRFVKQEHYNAFVKDGTVPFRRELTDQELLDALRPDLRERLRTPTDLAAHARAKFPDFVARLNWGIRTRAQTRPPGGEQRAYDTYFDAAGKLKSTYFAWGYGPQLDMHRWAAAYWATNDAKWARAVRDAFEPFYHVCRPPLNKPRRCGDSGAPWKTLVAGAFTPALVEAYAMVHDSPDWHDADHLNFLKAMLERGRFLRYTTTPPGPWLPYSPFGSGNWLLYQLQGLLAIAVHFPEFAESADWLDHATRSIGVHGDWVVMPDSGFDEYSLSYARQVAGQMAYCYGLFIENRLPLPPRFDRNLLRLHEMFLKIARPGGEGIPFGDTHRGGLGVTSECRWAALAFLDGRFKYFAGAAPDDFIDTGARLLHPEAPASAAARYRAMEPIRPSAQSHILPEPGWVVMRSGWENDATVIGLAYRGSDRVFHSGWEMLGLNLYAGGEPLLPKQLGFESYMLGFPEGFCRTPRQANQVLIEGADMDRVAGSLRNWFTSESLDYLDVDHRAWHAGSVRYLSRRRLLFIKPDWMLVVDDVEGPGDASLLWQALSDERVPKLDNGTVAVAGTTATATVVSATHQLTTDALPVPGYNKSVHRISATQTGALPLRFVTLIHIGPGGATTALRHTMREDNGTPVLEFAGREDQAHTVTIEPAAASDGRFLCWSGPSRDGKPRRFFASDGNPSAALQALLGSAGETPAWNGRALLLSSDGDGANSAPASQTVESLTPESVDAFAYHGRLEMTVVGIPARVVWQTPERAVHSVRYRETGKALWQRQLQPGLHQKAWVLLPDLTPGAEYELQVVSELESGRVLTSTCFRRTAPREWKP